MKFYAFIAVIAVGLFLTSCSNDDLVTTNKSADYIIDGDPVNPPIVIKP